MRVEPAGELLVPLAGGRTAQVIAVRSNGTPVRVGQMLTETAPEIGPIPVAPIAGRLGAARQVVLAGGIHVPAVVVQRDPADGTALAAVSSAQPSRPFADRDDLRRDNLPGLIDHLRRGGIQADRRSSPDLIGQLLMALQRPVHVILCNLLDADPPLRLSATVAAHAPETIVRLVATLRDACGAGSAAMVIDQALPDAWLSGLRTAARSKGVRVIGLINDYPQSDPSMLVHRLVGRRSRPGRLPMEQGVVLLDGAAALAAGQWLIDGQPMTTVPVGVFDHVRREQYYAHVPIGMDVDALLAALEVDTQHTTLRAGDLLRDVPLWGDHLIAGGELNLHVLQRETCTVVEPCIRCGWCVQGCPTRIQPAGLLDAAQRADLSLADWYGLESCIECGICSWVCPSQLPLLDGIRTLKRLRTAT